MADKDGVIIGNAFLPRKNRHQFAQKDFDKEYDNISIVDSVKKVGDGEDDFVVVKKVIHSKRPIQEVIDADKESVGVYNIIKQVVRTGDTSLLPVDKGDCHVDLTGAPETLMEVKAAGVKAEKAFKDLPKDLTKGLDMASFVESMTQEQFNSFIAAVAARSQKQEVKKEVKGNE